MARVLDAATGGLVALALLPHILDEQRRTVERVSPAERETSLARLRQAAILISPPRPSP
jgi:hypothetical protein